MGNRNVVAVPRRQGSPHKRTRSGADEGRVCTSQQQDLTGSIELLSIAQASSGRRVGAASATSTSLDMNNRTRRRARADVSSTDIVCNGASICYSARKSLDRHSSRQKGRQSNYDHACSGAIVIQYLRITARPHPEDSPRSELACYARRPIETDARLMD